MGGDNHLKLAEDILIEHSSLWNLIKINLGTFIHYMGKIDKQITHSEHRRVYTYTLTDLLIELEKTTVTLRQFIQYLEKLPQSARTTFELKKAIEKKLGISDDYWKQQ